MKIGYPKKILKSDTFVVSNTDVNDLTYTEFKFNGKVYEGCYEYIHFWKNGLGKWKATKIYLEKGNVLYRYWHKYKVNGVVDYLYKFVEW